MIARVTALAILAAVSTGCVERTLTVTSEPSGALVTIGDNEVGRTPLKTTFKYHGTYDVLVTLDGYEPLRTTAKASAPLYEYPGPDLVAEVLPFKFRNNQEWHFVLEPRLQDALTTSELEAGMVERAMLLREQLAQTPPPAPPKRPWLEGEPTEPAPDDADTPDAEPAQPQSAAEPIVAEQPVAEPPVAEPPASEQPAPPPARPVGQMVPIKPNN